MSKVKKFRELNETCPPYGKPGQTFFLKKNPGGSKNHQPSMFGSGSVSTAAVGSPQSAEHLDVRTRLSGWIVGNAT